MNVDLHCHSTASDGALSPTALVARAHEHGVRTLALTDHDTLEGQIEARTATRALGMQWVSGVELSCTWGGATIHVLGYGFALDAPAIEAAVKSEILDQVIEAIEKSASTGKIGDGKIFVFDLEQAIRIRTGESGAEAL